MALAFDYVVLLRHAAHILFISPEVEVELGITNFYYYYILS